MTTKQFEKILTNRNHCIDSLFKRPDSLSDLLPYDEYYAQDGVFILKDGSLGVVYEMKLFEHEPMTEKQILRTISSLKPWLNLPENCTLQIIHEQSLVSSRDDKITALAKAYPDAHPVSRFLFEKKLADLKSCCNGETKTPVFKRSTFIAIRYFPTN